MRQGELYSCDICQKTFVGREGVRNEVYIYNGESEGNFSQVCDKCCRKIGETILELKPKKLNE